MRTIRAILVVLSFANAAWKASPAFSVQILDSEGNIIAESDKNSRTPHNVKHMIPSAHPLCRWIFIVNSPRR